MDIFPNIVPKEEPESDSDEDMDSSPDTNSGEADNVMVTDIKEELNSLPEELEEIEEVAFIISKFEVAEDLIQEKGDEDPVEPDFDDNEQGSPETSETSEDLQDEPEKQCVEGAGDESIKKPRSISKDDRKLAECPICHLKILRLKRHMITHEAPTLKCKICGLMFRQRDSLRKHHRRVHVKTNPFPCSKCDNTFGSTWELKRHLISHDEQKQFQCPKCGTQFKWPESLQQHLKLDGEDCRRKCEICNRLVENWEQHKRQHSGEEEGFACEICPKVYETDDKLNKHVVEYHVAEKEMSRCPKCQKMFATPPTMQRHLATVHSEKRSFECNVCRTTFKRRDFLKKHVRRVHAEKKDKC